MSLSNYAENAQLDALFAGTCYVSLHNDAGDENGSNEISGGPGPYARQSVTFNAASGGTKTSAVAVTFLGMPSEDIYSIGIWDAIIGGNFLAYGYCDPDFPCAFICLADDLIHSPDHNVVAGDVIVFSDERLNGSLPGELDTETIFFAVDPITADTFSVAYDPEDPAESITDKGSGTYIKGTLKQTLSGWKFLIPSGSLIVRLT